MPRTAILGAGLMGSAMAWPLSDNHNEVRLIGTHLDDETIKSCRGKRFHPRLGRTLPESVESYYFSEIEKALFGCELIVSGVNSLGMGWMAEQLAKRAVPGQMIVGITKGLEAGPDGEVRLFPHILKAALPAEIRESVRFAAIGGPCIAGELAGRRPSFVMLGADDLATAEKLAAIFRTSYYFPTPTADLLGLETGVALKNAYTVAVGMAYGILEKEGGIDAAGASMHNLAAALFAQGCGEIRTILQLLGATDWFASSLPGAGDLYVTSMGGRTVLFGRLLGSGLGFRQAREIMAKETLESIEIIKSMGKLLPVWQRKALIRGDELPLMRTLIDVIVNEKKLDLPFGSLFRQVNRTPER
ncbi:MAG: glycerol-3-phosphate dehydrogenase [Spirochaetes bacterium]|nr:glycerol-3-phosphate dehydrogenase [Spirochaetota bacterium]